MQGDVTRTFGQSILDNRPRKAHPPVIVKDCSRRRHVGNAGIRCLAEADFLEDLKHRLINRSDRRRIERFEAATLKPRANRPQRLRQRCGSQAATCRTAATTPSTARYNHFS